MAAVKAWRAKSCDILNPRCSPVKTRANCQYKEREKKNPPIDCNTASAFYAATCRAGGGSSRLLDGEMRGVTCSAPCTIGDVKRSSGAIRKTGHAAPADGTRTFLGLAPFHAPAEPPRRAEC